MVKRKGVEEVNWFTDHVERMEKRHPVIETRWYVVEVTPRQRYSYDNGHGGAEYDWTDEKVIRVSNHFDSHEAAIEFFDTHEPDDGKELKVYKQEKHRTVTENWWSPFPVKNA